MKKNFWLRLAALLLSLLLLSGAAFADERGDLTLADLNDMAAIAQSVEGKVTLMLYMCGSSLESERGYASGDLAEVMASGFDEQKVTVLVMAGGSASDWKLPGIRSDATCSSVLRLIIS